jgi:hypothetical protein
MNSFYFGKDRVQPIELGKPGKKLAAGYLPGLHYSVLHRNWRYSLMNRTAFQKQG